MQLTITIDPQSYTKHAREQEATVGQLARKLKADVSKSLRPCFKKAAEGMLNDTLMQMDGADFKISVRDSYDDLAWRELYASLADGDELPDPIFQDDVIAAMEELIKDVECGWLSATAVRMQLARIDKVATLHRCLEYYNRLVDCVAARQLVEAAAN